MSAYHVHSLTLYCDNRKRSVNVPYQSGMLKSDLQGHEYIELKPGEHFDGEFPMEFLNSDPKVCVQRAKDMGWYFHRDGRTVCPRCHKGGIKLKKGEGREMVDGKIIWK